MSYMPKSAVSIAPQAGNQKSAYIPRSAKPVEAPKKSVSGFLTNIIKSGANTLSDLGQVVMHPIQTAKSLYKVGSGAVQLAVPGEQGNEQAAGDVGQFYKQRYGGAENIKSTLYNDPVGSLLDVSAVAGLGAGAVRTASKVAGTVGRVETAAKLADTAGTLRNVERATNVLNPVSSFKGAKGLVTGTKEADTVGNIAKMGQNISEKGQEYGLKGYGRPATVAGFEQGTKVRPGFGSGEASNIIGKYGITRDADGVAKLDDVIESLNDSYQGTVGAKTPVPLNSVYKEVRSRIDELMAENTEVSKAKAIAMQKELENFFQVSPNFKPTLEDLTKRRKVYQEAVKNYKFDDASKGTYQEMRDAFQRAIYKNLENLGDTQAKTLGKELNKLITFRDQILVPASRTGTTTKAFSGIRDVLPPAAAWALTSNPIIGAGVWGAEKLLSSPQGVATTSKIIKGVGETVKGVGQSNIIKSMEKYLPSLGRGVKTGSRNPYREKTTVKFSF